MLELSAARYAEVHVESSQELERRTLSFETKVGHTLYSQLKELIARERGKAVFNMEG